jgi:hypothetical protein
VRVPALAAAAESGGHERVVRGRDPPAVRVRVVARRRVLESWPAAVWRTGMTVDRALAVHAVTASLDAFDLAVHERGWSPDETERWWQPALGELILAG